MWTRPQRQRRRRRDPVHLAAVGPLQRCLLMALAVAAVLRHASGAFLHPSGAAGSRRTLVRRYEQPPEGLGIGIDLGTTFSAVAYLDDDGVPHIIPTPRGDRIIPSVVALEGDGRAVVGWDAVPREDAYRHVKRVIGTGGRLDPSVRDLVPHVRPNPEGKTHKKDSLLNQLHDAVHHPTLLRSTVPAADGATLRPEVVSGRIVASLRAQAEAATGRTVTRAVVGVPAYFNEAQRNATVEAARLAGIDKVRLLREPEAAALAYGAMRSGAGAAAAGRHPQRDVAMRDELVLVLDLGGGTYDVSILLVGDGVSEIVCTSGNVRLGGADMDQKVGRFLMGVLGRHGAQPGQWSEQAVTSLLRVSEKLRVYLSNSRSVNAALPLAEEDWRQMEDAVGTILPLDFHLDGDNVLPETGISNATHCLIRMTRKQLDSLCREELLALLRPMREVAIAGGALLPGDADPAMVQTALELDALDKLEFPEFYESDDVDPPAAGEAEALLRQMKMAKKAQQRGRRQSHKTARDQRKFRAEKKALPRVSQKVQRGIHGRPISRVVLVGGTTRMPAIGRLIEAVTGVVPQRTVDPDEAVALGCAVHVGVLDGDERMGAVLNPMQAAIVRALAKKQGLVDGGLLEDEEFDEDFDDESDYDSMEIEMV